MKEAARFPITTLELDVVISKDKQVVVSHEPWMSEEICLDSKGRPVKGRAINLYALDYSQIKTFDCGTKLHPRFPQQKKVAEYKPLLSDLLKELEPLKLNFNIEIKSTEEEEKKGFQPEYKNFSDLVVAQITKILPKNRFTIQSFDWRVLQYLHKTYPQIGLVALRETPYTTKNVLKELGFTPAVFSPDYTLLTAKDVTFFQRKKIKVIPWTVNTLPDMKKVIALGVDGIITDYPNLVIEIPLETYQLIPECSKNFTRFEGQCVRVPRFAEPSQQNPGWLCKYGYIQKRNSCVKIKLPKHAAFAEDGKTWTCNPGYERYRYSCRRMK
ncbi:MAG: glycerophosphodiester phosphodiesterase [Bdellovibrionales bacterium]|nr:glycerophosphodiester phosphodiesterase [Bdellovibrionales bacterium]